MEIRIAREQDVPALRDIYNYEVEHATSTFDMTPRTMEDRMEWFRAHNVDNHPLLVAEEDGRVVGYASLSPYRPKDAFQKTVELSVYVDRRCRGRGVGKALLTAILAEAERRPDIHSVVSVITGGNEASIRLHERFGFTCSGTLHQVGEKFGRYLDVVHYERIVTVQTRPKHLLLRP